MDVEYRFAGIKELKQLAEKVEQGKFPVMLRTERLEIDQVLAGLRKRAINRKARDYLVALHEKEIIGFARFEMLDKREGNLGVFEVLDEHRGKGIGGELLKRVERELKKKGAQRLLVGTKTHEAKKWYEKKGFQLRKEETLTRGLKISILEKRL